MVIDPPCTELSGPEPPGPTSVFAEHESHGRDWCVAASDVVLALTICITWFEAILQGIFQVVVLSTLVRVCQHGLYFLSSLLLLMLALYRTLSIACYCISGRCQRFSRETEWIELIYIVRIVGPQPILYIIYGIIEYICIIYIFYIWDLLRVAYRLWSNYSNNSCLPVKSPITE